MRDLLSMVTCPQALVQCAHEALPIVLANDLRIINICWGIQGWLMSNIILRHVIFVPTHKYKPCPTYHWIIGVWSRRVASPCPQTFLIVFPSPFKNQFAKIYKPWCIELFILIYANHIPFGVYYMCKGQHGDGGCCDPSFVIAQHCCKDHMPN